MLEATLREFVDGLSEKIRTLQNDKPGASQLKALIEAQLRKLHLVTREEFDAQTAVLKRTREKLDDLERKLSELEAAEK